jgi:hypothetical protein
MKNSDYTYNYFIEAFDQAKTEAAEIISSTDEEILIRKPSEKKWSMLEILSHLIEAGNEYLHQIKKGLNKPDDKLARAKEPFTPNFIFRWFIGQVSPENPKKLPTVPSFKPVDSSNIDHSAVLADFQTLQNEFIHILKKAKLEGLDLDGIKTRNPILKIIPMSLTACFGVTEAHQRRHFEQMNTLKKQFSL